MKKTFLIALIFVVVLLIVLASDFNFSFSISNKPMDNDTMIEFIRLINTALETFKGI